jgi:hypothetical protein
MKTKQTWVFYGGTNFKQSVKTIYFIKECKNPQRTKEYRKMMELLEDSTFKTVGHMTSTKWNEGHSLIKIG